MLGKGSRVCIAKLCRDRSSLQGRPPLFPRKTVLYVYSLLKRGTCIRFVFFFPRVFSRIGLHSGIGPGGVNVWRVTDHSASYVWSTRCTHYIYVYIYRQPRGVWSNENDFFLYIIPCVSRPDQYRVPDVLTQRIQ